MAQRLKRADHRLFLGKTTSGKSTLARYQIQKFSRVLIYDPNEEADHVIDGATVIYRAEELVRAARAPGAARIVWRGFRHLREDAFEFANRVALETGGFAILWDEVDRFTRRQGKSVLPPHAYDCIHVGRHKGLRVFSCSRRPASVNIDIRSQSARIMVARLTEPADIRWCREAIGEVAEKLPTLRDYHFLDWTERASKIRSSPFR